MCGTGVGFSVERQSVNKLPEVAEEFNETDTTIHVSDSKIGWAKAFRELVSLLYTGQVPSWDISKLRAKGERLKTFGGRSSGPDPLVALFHFTINTFRKAAGRKLTSIECHDIVCKIAEIVVVGGVRRSAKLFFSKYLFIFVTGISFLALRHRLVSVLLVLLLHLLLLLLLLVDRLHLLSLLLLLLILLGGDAQCPGALFGLHFVAQACA